MTVNFDAMDAIKKLKELLDMGAITREEFEAKKSELLSNISSGNVKEIQSVSDIDPKYSKDFSENGFWDKIKTTLKSAGLELIYKALQLYYAMQNPNCPMAIKAGIIAALGYFISPIDIIPDFIPFVGFTDDLAAIAAAIAMTGMYIDERVKRKAKEKIDEIFGAGTSKTLE
ncbi:MAG: DUF1232 domain-containing protein [Synergistaceae bacterium]|nr:DUF1232 domain-containing protein [Synergistaceae bacterium]